jgi:hypothetical protein
MDVAFPYPVKVSVSVPTLTGLRYQPFTNVDGETFAAPALNGFWKLAMQLIAMDMQSQLALSVFVTQMEAAGATCVVPVAVKWRPNDGSGRMLAPSESAEEYTFDHVGWDGAPFAGFTLRAAVAHRDSYIDINKPGLSQLWPGHYITLDDRLYHVVKVSAIGESETAIRVSVMPNIRGAHASGKVVVVDQLALKCKMESGDQIGSSHEIMRLCSVSFVEAF